MAGLDRTEQGKTGLDRTELDRAGLDYKQNRTRQNTITQAGEDYICF